MSLVWTFTVIVPYFRGQNFINNTCKLVGLNGVPWRCQNESYFADIKFDHRGQYKAGRYCPKEQENCNAMMDEDNCIAFYVEDNVGKRHILHEDEVDIGTVNILMLRAICPYFFMPLQKALYMLNKVGICDDLYHCSVKKIFKGGTCDSHINCDNIIRLSKKYIETEQLHFGQVRDSQRVCVHILVV